MCLAAPTWRGPNDAAGAGRRRSLGTVSDARRADGGGGLAELASLLLDRGRSLGAHGAETVGAGVEDAVARFVRARAERAILRAQDWSDQQLVAGFEADDSSLLSRLGRKAGRAGASRAARRLGRARSLASRSPAGLALRYGPEVVESILADLRAIDALCRYLAGRARDADVDIDLEAFANVAVQILVGHGPDPDGPVPHAALAKGWLTGLGRRLTPFMGSGHRAGDVDAILLAASTLDVRLLGRRRGRFRRIIDG